MKRQCVNIFKLHYLQLFEIFIQDFNNGLRADLAITKLSEAIEK